MTDTSSAPQGAAQPALLRHILPVVVGGAVALLLTIVTDNTLSAHGLLPAPEHPVFETGPLVLAAAYRALFTVLGAHLAARLAPEGQPRIRYAIALGMMLFIVNVLGAQSLRGLVPTWYWFAGIALPVPCAIIGGGTAVRALEARARAASKA